MSKQTNTSNYPEIPTEEINHYDLARFLWIKAKYKLILQNKIQPFSKTRNNLPRSI